MSKCKYVAKGIMCDTSNPISPIGQMSFEGETLPEVTRQVRKQVKLVHGNLIRTALIEEGVFHLETMGRKKSNADTRYVLDIYVVRDRMVDIK